MTFWSFILQFSREGREWAELILVKGLPVWTLLAHAHITQKIQKIKDDRSNNPSATK